MVNAFLEVRDLGFETFEEPFGDLAEKDSGLGGGIEKGGIGIAPKLLREKVKHLVNEPGGCEDFIVTKVSKTVEDVR